MSEKFDCDFLFGDSMVDVKKMDYSLLKGKVTETHTKYVIGRWYWQSGVVEQLFKNYDNYILLGETRALSTWLFCILARILKPKKKVLCGLIDFFRSLELNSFSLFWRETSIIIYKSISRHLPLKYGGSNSKKNSFLLILGMSVEKKHLKPTMQNGIEMLEVLKSRKMKRKIEQECASLNVIDKSKKCFVITRFNLHLYKKDKEDNPVLTEEWLKDRFCLFETYCLPSLKNQTIQTFYWIVLFADDTPEPYKQRALQIHKEYNAFLPFFLNEEDTLDYNGFVRDVIRYLKDDSRLLITIRIDNDDAINYKFIESAYNLSQQQSDDVHLYTYKYGVQFYVKAVLADRVPYPHNHFVIMIDRHYNSESCRHVLQFNHGKIHQLDIPFTCINDKHIMWAEVIHGRNMDNDFMMQPNHRPLLTRNVLIDKFGWKHRISVSQTLINIPFFLLPTAFHHIVHRVKQRLGIIEKNH